MVRKHKKASLKRSIHHEVDERGSHTLGKTAATTASTDTHGENSGKRKTSKNKACQRGSVPAIPIPDGVFPIGYPVNGRTGNSSTDESYINAPVLLIQELKHAGYLMEQSRVLGRWKVKVKDGLLEGKAVDGLIYACMSLLLQPVLKQLQNGICSLIAICCNKHSVFSKLVETHRYNSTSSLPPPSTFISHELEKITEILLDHLPMFRNSGVGSSELDFAKISYNLHALRRAEIAWYAFSCLDPDIVLSAFGHLVAKLSQPYLAAAGLEADSQVQVITIVQEYKGIFESLAHYLRSPIVAIRLAHASESVQTSMNLIVQKFLVPWLTRSEGHISKEILIQCTGILSLLCNRQVGSTYMDARVTNELSNTKLGLLRESTLRFLEKEKKESSYLFLDLIAPQIQDDCCTVQVIRSIMTNFPREVIFQQKPKIAVIVFHRLCKYLNHSRSAVRLSAFHGLDAWLKFVAAEYQTPAILLTFEDWETWIKPCIRDVVDIFLLKSGHSSKHEHSVLCQIFEGVLNVQDSVSILINSSSLELDEQRKRNNDLALERQKLLRRLIHLVTESNQDTATVGARRAAFPALEMLVTKVGAQLLIELEPRLLDYLLHSMDHGNVLRNAAASFYCQILVHLNGTSHDSEWITGLSDALCLSEQGKRMRIGQIILPKILKELPSVAKDLLLSLDRHPLDDSLWAKVRIWNVMRSLGASISFSLDTDLIGVRVQEGFENARSKKAKKIKHKAKMLQICIDENLMHSALQHGDDNIRSEAFGIVTGVKKISVLPNRVEIELCRKHIPLVLKEATPDKRNFTRSMVRKLLSWIQTASEARYRAHDSVETNEVLAQNVEFVHWLQELCMAQIYPSAPFDRINLGLEILWEICTIFGPDLGFLKPLLENSDNIFVLLNTFMVSFDRARILAYDILMQLPSPLPGINSMKKLQPLIRWAKILMGSNRLRECDAGATILRLVRKKYIVELGWAVRIYDEFEFDDRKKRKRERHVDEIVDSAQKRAKDLVMMRLACAEARKCERSEKAYCVGAIITSKQEPEKVLAAGYSREFPGNTHAEECALMKIGNTVAKKPEIDDISLGKAKGCTIYTTMEPCSTRLSGNRSCTSRCISAKLGRIVVGVHEPSKFVNCTGTSQIKDVGINIEYISDQRLARECMQPNMFLFPEERVMSDAEEKEFNVLCKKDLELHRSRSNGENLAPLLGAGYIDLFFAWQAVDLLRARVAHFRVGKQSIQIPEQFAGMDEPLDRTSNIPLMTDEGRNVSGILLALSYIWRDRFVEAEKEKKFSEVCLEWRLITEELVNELIQCVDKALSMISDIDDDADNNDSSFAPNSVDCRGHVILNNADDVEQMTDEKASAQKIVVSSWLLVREGCNCLTNIVRFSLLENERSHTDDAWVLSEATTKKVGEWFLRALINLKHKGAIEHATNAFQDYCNRLLRIKATNPNSSLAELPKVFMVGLIQRLKKQEHNFLLRRSAGFACSFAALTRAELADCRPELLITLMKELLILGKSSNWHSAVHSLNIMTQLLGDSSLYKDLEGYYADALKTTIVGFKSDVWAVRNSSMNAFSRILDRVVRTKISKDETSSINGITSNFFFSKYPSLYGFLLEELNSACAFERKVENRNVATISPSLYPILLIFSRLRPSLSSTENDQRYPMTPFIPLFLQCCSDRHAMARAMGARALASCIPREALCKIVTSSSNKLENHVESFNELHGVVLVITQIMKVWQFSEEHHLFQSTCNYISMISELMKYLPKVAKCPYLRDDIWKCIEVLFDVAVNVENTNVELLTIDNVRDAAANGVPSALNVLVKLAVNSDAHSWTESICALLLDGDAKTRLLLFIPLKKLAKTCLQESSDEIKNANTPVWNRILDVMVTRFFQEFNTEDNYRGKCFPPELRMRLKFFRYLLLLTTNPVDNVFGALINIYHSHESEKLKGPALRAIGTLIPRMTMNKLAYEKVAPIIISASAASNTLPLRVSAAKCLHDSRILATGKSPSLSAWIAIVLLLQDESSDIRSFACGIACSALGSKYLVERLTLRNSFEKVMSSTMSTDPHANYFRCEIKKVLDMYISDGSKDFNLNADAVFEREEDNIYKEPLLEQQLHALLDHVNVNISSEEKSKSRENKKLVHFQETLRSCLPLISNLDQRTDWLGGPTFHSTIYTELYACILSCTRQQAIIPPDLKQECKRFLQQTTHIHPSVRKSLQIFSESGNTGLSADNVYDICFLT